MKYLSLFSGVGGFELGIQRMATKPENSTHTEKRASQHSFSPLCIGYSEIDKYAIQTYQKHFKEHINYGDATKINERELPDFDLLVGGFPCQAFSIAGKRKGFEDTRGTLFFDIARILKHKRPRHFVLENVKGLLSHDSGKTFQTILGVLSDLGYGVEWQVLNGKRWVPQNRERIIIVGHLRGECSRKVLPFTGESNNDTGNLRQAELAYTIDANYFKGVSPKSYQGSKRQLIQIVGGSQGNRVYDTSGVSSTIASQAGGLGAKTGLYAVPVLTPDRLNKRQNGRRFKKDGEPSFTLNTQDKHGIYNGSRIRRLTPLECERLMGWPDNWTAGVSDTQRYKQCGNGIIAPMVTEVITALLNEGCLTP